MGWGGGGVFMRGSIKTQTCDKAVCPAGFIGNAKAISVDSTSTPDFACGQNKQRRDLTS